MLTTLSIVSFDQGKIWREVAAPTEPVEKLDAETKAEPRLLPAFRLPVLGWNLRLARG